MPFDALVLDAPLRQALVTVRSLGRRGLRVAAAGPTADVPAFRSRWCRERVVLGSPEDRDRYLAALEEWLERAGARVIIASHDGTIALLREQRTRLQRSACLALADEGALAVAVNKERTLAAARRLGVPVPRECVVRARDDLDEALRVVGLPAVVKPCESWLWCGARGSRLAPELVVTAAEARRAVHDVLRFGQPVLFQRLLSGRREAVSVVYADGEICARFAQWALRTRPLLGGESVVRQSIPVPADIGRYAELLVRDLGLEGYAEVEFRRDEAGVPYLMEVNPRLSASVEIAVRAGVDFPFLLYQWARGGPVDRVETYRTGGWMRHLGADIDVTIAALQERGRPGVASPARALLGFGRSFFTPMGYDYFDWTDPRPAVQAATGFVRASTRRVVSRMRRMLS
jgi:predicted ATP-grasp superfamily ATP-dependent carboligase